MKTRYDNMVSVLRLLVEEELKSRRRDLREPEFTRDEIVDAELRNDMFFFTLTGGRSWYARPDELKSREILELLDWAEIKAVEASIA